MYCAMDFKLTRIVVLIHIILVQVLLTPPALAFSLSKVLPKIRKQSSLSGLQFESSKRATSKSSDRDVYVNTNNNEIAYLYKTLEESLLNDTNLLYTLQKEFFPPEGHLNVVTIPFSVSILIENINKKPEHQSSFNCSVVHGGCLWSNICVDWYPEDPTTEYDDELKQYVILIHDRLRELEYVSWNILQLLPTFGQSEEHPPVSFTLRVNKLEFLPQDDDVRMATLSLMTWVKAYARSAFSQPIEKADTDKGDVYIPDRQPDFFLEVCVILLFLSLNLFITLMAGVFLKSFSSFLVRRATALLKESVKTLCLYWATALVFTAANIICLGADLYAFQTTIREGFDYLLPTKIVTVLFVLITEPFIVYYTTRHFSNILNLPQRVVQALCCCFSQVYGSRFAHTIAVVNILWFFHRICTAFILVLFHIVVSPAETFTTVTMIFTAFIITIFIVANVLHTCSTRRKKISFKTFCKVFCVMITGALALVVVASFSLVYLILLDNGLQTSGVGGFLLSLFPPFLFFTIGLFIQKKFFRTKETSKDKEELRQPSSSTGNITRLAEYQQLEAEGDQQNRMLTEHPNRQRLSVQFSTSDYERDSGLGENVRYQSNRSRSTSVRQPADAIGARNESSSLLNSPNDDTYTAV